MTMHADQVPIDADLAARLIGDQFPDLAGLPVAPVESPGTVNALFRVGDLVARFPLAEWGVDPHEREERWLPTFQAAVAVAVPEFVGRGQPGHGYPFPWALHQWIGGSNPDPDNLGDTDRWADHLAAVVGAIRSVDPTGAPPAHRSEQLAQRDAGTRRAIDAASDLLDVAAILAVWEPAVALPGWSGPPTWTHGDLMPGNLLERDRRLHAVLDWAGAGVGDPAGDLIPAWYVLPASARRRFRAAVGADDVTWLRGRGWALSIALAALPYYRDSNEHMFENARRVIDEILAEA